MLFCVIKINIFMSGDVENLEIAKSMLSVDLKLKYNLKWTKYINDGQYW